MIQIKIDTGDGTIGEILNLLHIPAVKIDCWDESYPIIKPDLIMKTKIYNRIIYKRNNK
jgi:hypothetical protein